MPSTTINIDDLYPPVEYQEVQDYFNKIKKYVDEQYILDMNHKYYIASNVDGVTPVNGNLWFQTFS